MATFVDTELGLYAPHNPIGACTVDDRYCFFFGGGDEFAIFDSVAGTSKAYSGIGTAFSFRGAAVDDNGDVWTTGKVVSSSLIRVATDGSVLVKPSSVVAGGATSVYYDDGAIWTGCEAAGTGIVRWDRSTLTPSSILGSQVHVAVHDGIAYMSNSKHRWASDGTPLADDSVTHPDFKAHCVTDDGILVYTPSGSDTVAAFDLVGNKSNGSITVPSGTVNNMRMPTLGSDGLVYFFEYASPYTKLVVLDPMNMTVRSETFTTGRAERGPGTDADGVMYVPSGTPDPR